MSAPFRDRTDAGRQLAAALRDRGVVADLVLAIPRGGLPVGREVADALDRPLDVAIARKVGAPSNPELALGAVGSDGTLWLNDDLIAELGVDDGTVAAAVERERGRAEAALERYRAGRDPPAVAGRRVLLVDDGVATGATTIACVRQLRAAGAARVVVAVPVGPPSTLEVLRGEADDVVCLHAPRAFGAVGAYYEAFGQVSDEAAVALLGAVG